MSRKKMTWPSTGRTTGGAVTSRVFDPGTGWTLQEARGLLDQGYSSAQIARRTGFPEAMIRVGTSSARLG